MSGTHRSSGRTRPRTTVHNEGSSSVVVRIVVHGDRSTVESVQLAAGESHTVRETDGGAIEVHTRKGMATTLAGSAPLVVIRDGRVLVAPN